MCIADPKQTKAFRHHLQIVNRGSICESTITQRLHYHICTHIGKEHVPQRKILYTYGTYILFVVGNSQRFLLNNLIMQNKILRSLLDANKYR